MLYSMAGNGSWNNSCVIPSVALTLLQLLVCIDGCICSAAPEACPPIPSGYDPTLLIYVPFGQTKVYHLQCACKQKPLRTSGQSQLLAWLHMIHEVWLHISTDCKCMLKEVRTSHAYIQAQEWLRHPLPTWVCVWAQAQQWLQQVSAHVGLCLGTSTTIATTVHCPHGFVSRYKHNNCCNRSLPMWVWKDVHCML